MNPIDWLLVTSGAMALAGIPTLLLLTLRVRTLILRQQKQIVFADADETIGEAKRLYEETRRHLEGSLKEKSSYIKAASGTEERIKVLEGAAIIVRKLTDHHRAGLQDVLATTKKDSTVLLGRIAIRHNLKYLGELAAAIDDLTEAERGLQARLKLRATNV